jgi:hypothetical protein
VIRNRQFTWSPSPALGGSSRVFTDAKGMLQARLKQMPRFGRDDSREKLTKQDDLKTG